MGKQNRKKNKYIFNLNIILSKITPADRAFFG